MLFVAFVLGPIAWWFGISLIKLIRYIAAELMIVVGTSSSESVFPRLNAKLRQLGVDEPVVALVLPSGYAIPGAQSVETLTRFIERARELERAGA